MRLLLVLVLSLFSVFAYSALVPISFEDHYFIDSDSARSACESFSLCSFRTGPMWTNSQVFKPDGDSSYSRDRCSIISPQTPTFASCVDHNYKIVSSCPVGTSPDSSGRCVDPEPDPDDICEEKLGEKTFSNVADKWSFPQTACFSGCDAYHTAYYPISNGMFQVEYVFSGEQCSGSGNGEGSGGEGGDPEDLEPVDQQPIEPTKEETKEETKADGSSTESTTKTEKTTSADGTTTETTTTTETKTNPDGSTSTTETTETKTTNSSGGTSTSTGSTTTHRDPQGNVTGIDASQQTSKDDEPEKGKVSGGDDCAAPPRCEGDALQCEMIRQQWLSRCPAIDDLTIKSGIAEGEEGLTFASSLASFQGRIESVPLIDDLGGFFTLPSGGTCPVWSADTGVFVVTIDQFCSNDIPWSLIRGMVIACALFAGARIAFT